jgi:glyoxylase-like metal-dependent hydrolase (beta-lactamase superfamily II)
VTGRTDSVLGDGYRFTLSDGHTPGLLLTEIDLVDGPVMFAGDLIPGVPWIHVPITMGYDRYPELLIDEKQAILTDLESRGGRLFFTHDSETAVAGIGRGKRDKFTAVDRLDSVVGMS